jgi:hypothetical protein
MTKLHLLVGLIWLTLAVLMGGLGRHRTMGFWGYFFASLVLTPIMGLLLVLVSGKRDAE